MPREKPFWWQYTTQAALRFVAPWAVKYVEPA